MKLFSTVPFSALFKSNVDACRVAVFASVLFLPGALLAMPGMQPERTVPDADEPPAQSSVTEQDADTRERVTLWLDMYRAEPLPFEAVMEDLEEVDIVYVGETHTLKRHHQWQAKILENLIEAKDGRMVLGLEQIEQFNQPEVDRFNAGEIDFDELAKEINWSRRWSNYEDYRPLLELAQRKGVPVLALNGRAETIRKVGRHGLDELDRSERRELPARMDFDDPDYRRLLDQMMMVHASIDEDTLERIFQAQVARDENMAETLADFLQEPGHRDYSAMVVAGSGHLSYGLGTVDRVRARLPQTSDRIVLMTVSGDLVLSESQKRLARPVTITHEDLRYLQRPKADYLQLTEPDE
ncbi:MAG: ChaN family lipoprotein [Puniceicoccales bacterium]